MEWLNVLALLIIALSNVFIGVMVKNQITHPTDDEKFETLRLQALHLECALKNALQEIPQRPAPVVTVLAEPSYVSFDLDYEKLGKAIKRGILEAKVTLHNVTAPLNPIPYEPVPYWQDPVVNMNTYEDGHTLYSSVEIEGVPARQFPLDN